jgi:tRNA-dihydrouridine synthase B
VSSRALPFAPTTMLAPMEGVSTAPFRALIADKGGVGVVSTEFVRINDHHMPSLKLGRLVERARDDVWLSVQVMGREVSHMEVAARIMSDAGADIVDINLGCPSPKAVRGGVGSAMLKDHVLLHRVLSTMRRVVPRVLSAKMRAGFDDASGALATARVLVDAGVDFIVIHPRRRVDFYEGVADWRIIRMLARELPVPVVGNGDVWNARAALRMRDETGCAGVMIGRPAMRNPWIFTQADALARGDTPFSPAGADVARYMRDFVEAYSTTMSRVPVGRVKELVRMIARAVPDRGFSRRVLMEQTVDDILRRVDDEVGPLSPQELDLDAEGSLRLERSGSTIEPASEEGPPPTVVDEGLRAIT